MLQVGDGIRNLLYAQFVLMFFVLGLAEVFLRLRGQHGEVQLELDQNKLPAMSFDAFRPYRQL